jgi:DNA-binding CsgD family transcriptional regulator
MVRRFVVAPDSATPRARSYRDGMTQITAIRQAERRFASRGRDAWTAVPKAVSDSAPEGLAPRGRRDECAVLDALLEGARTGESGALVVRGEAGVGKTALLEYAIRSARDLDVTRAMGIESEMKLAFAALHQLCAPRLDRLDRLPVPQREALQTAFGLNAGPAPDRFFVGLAVLSLLSEVAEERPLVCVLDDAQWLDSESAHVLAFVARRLRAESVVLLLAEREPSDAFRGLAELVVGGLRDADARALLASVIPGRMDERIVDEVLAETRGNPLALLELPRGLTAAQLAGGFGLVGALSLQGRIEESFVARLEALPEDTQRRLLVAAAEPTGDPGVVSRAAQRLDIAGAALEPAESAGLIDVGGRVRFRHPLVRSAVYRAASPAQRRGVHRALAEATNAQADPDRRAWHLAEAAAGPEEDVAFELERAAGRAQARGGLAAAAAFLERAAALTPAESRRARRALAAAQVKFEAGALDDALALLATARTGAAGPQRARADLLRARIAFASRRGGDAPRLLLRAARELEACDADLARATYMEALLAAMLAGGLARAGAAEVSEVALAGPPPPSPARPSDLLLQGLAIRFTRSYAEGVSIVKEALRAFHRQRALPPQEARWLFFAAWAASDLWDDEAATLLSTRELELARDAGALAVMPIALSARSVIHAMSGELAAAASLLDELRVVTEATGIAVAPYGAIWLAALRGREVEAAELLEATANDAVARGEGHALYQAGLAKAVLYNGLGRYEAALAAIRQADDRFDGMDSATAAAELVEAAARCGERELATRALARVAQTARASATEWALGMEARSAALLCDGDAAEGLYREAIVRLGRTRIRVQLARAHLLYGEWLRREHRRLEARGQLRAALEMFNAMGVEAFAGRAERELGATGERVRRRSVELRYELTAQEAQVARLARDGLSNAEIGERLFISRHTVAYHLRKVFSKLGITSRNQLARVLPHSVETGQVA